MLVPVGQVIRDSVAAGWEVESVGDTWVTFLGPEPPRTNHTLHGILSIFIPFYFIVWLFVALGKKPQRQRLTYAALDGMVDTDTQVLTPLYPKRSTK